MVSHARQVVPTPLLTHFTLERRQRAQAIDDLILGGWPDLLGPASGVEPWLDMAASNREAACCMASGEFGDCSAESGWLCAAGAVSIFAFGRIGDDAEVRTEAMGTEDVILTTLGSDKRTVVES